MWSHWPGSMPEENDDTTVIVNNTDVNDVSQPQSANRIGVKSTTANPISIEQMPSSQTTASQSANTDDDAGEVSESLTQHFVDADHDPHGLHHHGQWIHSTGQSLKKRAPPRRHRSRSPRQAQVHQSRTTAVPHHRVLRTVPRENYHFNNGGYQSSLDDTTGSS